MFEHGTDPILEFGQWLWPGGTGGASSQSFLWLSVFLPMPEVFLNKVQNFLVDPLLCHCITRAFAG